MAPSPELGQPKAPDKVDTNKVNSELTSDSTGACNQDSLKSTISTTTQPDAEVRKSFYFSLYNRMIFVKKKKKFEQKKIQQIWAMKLQFSAIFLASFCNNMHFHQTAKYTMISFGHFIFFLLERKIDKLCIHREKRKMFHRSSRHRTIYTLLHTKKSTWPLDTT